MNLWSTNMKSQTKSFLALYHNAQFLIQMLSKHQTCALFTCCTVLDTRKWFSYWQHSYKICYRESPSSLKSTALWCSDMIFSLIIHLIQHIPHPTLCKISCKSDHSSQKCICKVSLNVSSRSENCILPNFISIALLVILQV